MNLLEETLDVLKRNGRGPEDVYWVGSLNGEYGMPWDEFARIADIEYDSGFGGNEIDISLAVVGHGWWMERHEYDGSEWWEYKTQPIQQNPHRYFDSVLERHEPFRRAI